MVCSQDILVIFQVSTPDQGAAQQGYGEGQSVGWRKGKQHVHVIRQHLGLHVRGRNQRNKTPPCVAYAYMQRVHIIKETVF